MAAALPLGEIAGQFHALGKAAGFISSRVDTKTMSVTIYWYGSPPSVQPEILEKASSAGVTVNVIKAPFSPDQLEQVRMRLVPLMKPLNIGFLEHNGDGSGFTAHFRSIDSMRAAQASLSAAVSRATIVGVPPDDPLYAAPGSPQIIISDDAMDPTPAAMPRMTTGKLSDETPFNNVTQVVAYGRQNDTSPFYAGGRSTGMTNGDCTTGFPMHRGHYSDGTHMYLLSAGHCTAFADNQGIYTPTGLKIGVTSGSVTLVNAQLDVNLINVAIAGAGDEQWDGAWNSTGFSKEVWSDKYTAQGDPLCVSGSYSGDVCGLHVAAYGDQDYSGGVFYGWLITKDDNTAAAGQGDSG